MDDRALLDELSRDDADARVRKAATMKLSGASLSITKGNIMDLIEAGKITAKITSNPQGERNSHAPPHLRYRDDEASLLVTTERLVPWPLEVIIPAGTHFVYEQPWHDGSKYKSMISTEEATVAESDEIIHVIFADAEGRIPQTDVPDTMRRGGSAPHIALTTRVMHIGLWSISFALRRHPNEGELLQLMTHREWDNLKRINRDRYISEYMQGFAPRPMQAAVLIVTADASRDGFADVSAGFSKIDENDMARAMQLCAEAGIDIRQKRIWRDRRQILAVLEAGELKSWLEDCMERQP